jgi:hypothetical protein
MRAHARGVIAAIGVSGALLGMTGCGSADHAESPTATAGRPGAQVEIGNTINYGSLAHCDIVARTANR